MDVQGWLALFVLAGTVAAVMVRPPRLGEGGAALVGAAAVILLRLESPAEAAAVIRDNVEIFAFFAGLMLLAGAAEGAGLFDWLAVRALGSARGSSRRFMVNIFLIGTAVTVAFSNDATALLLTPAVIAASRGAALEPMPYALACTFIADSASATLPVSNPVNLLAMQRFDLSAREYLFVLAIPGLIAAAVNLAVFLRIFAADIRPKHTAGHLAVRGTPRARRLAGCALGLLGALYVGFAVAGLPLGLPALIVGVVLVAALQVEGSGNGGSALRSVSWQVLALVAGFLVVVNAFETTGVAAAIADRAGGILELEPALALVATAAVVGLATNLLNNWPAMILVTGIIATRQPADDAAVYGAILGGAIGPNLTIVGSLATVLWLALLRERGLRVSGVQYLRVGLAVTPAVLGSAALAAAVTISIR